METTETPPKTSSQPVSSPPEARPAAVPEPHRPVMDVAHPATVPAQAQPVTDKATPASQSHPTPEPPKLVEMHQAPVDTEHPTPSATEQPTKQSQPVQNPQHDHRAIMPHGPHRPIGAVLLIVMAMIILSGLAVLVYLNS